MLDFTNSIIDHITVHHIGSKSNGESIRFSQEPLDISDPDLQALLIQYFSNPFSNPEFHSFSFSNGDHKLNPMFQFAQSIFEDRASLIPIGKDIAKHLYDKSEHPQIKPGDLFVVYFSKLLFNNTIIDAIGLFKSENRQSFLKLQPNQQGYFIDYEAGINTEKMDKACFILNTDSEEGFKVCMVDKSNKSAEAQYWKEHFLNTSPCKDEYHFTKEALNIAKNYVTTQLDEDFEVNKADKIDLLNRSVSYFKTHETFNQEEFEQDVFQDSGVINSFRNFNESYQQENEITLSDGFEISNQAVKKQARIFKSVLKLDKNFHIYIHGDRELIEQGTDNNGRKFYKIYYEEEQ